nr:isochorismate synthase [Heyndrickxia coagulans]
MANEDILMKEKTAPALKLVSKVIKCRTAPDPLRLFTAGAARFYGSRFFWQDKNRETVFVGFGRVWSCTVTASDGFAQMEDEWRNLKGAGEVYSDTGETGTGPVLFGGFAFDGTVAKQEWKTFGQGIFRVPQILFTFKKDAVFLTVNGCGGTESVQEAEETARSLLNGSTAFPALPLLKAVKEIGSDEWKKSVATAVEFIREGRMDKVVLARKLELAFDGVASPDAVLAALSAQQHDSYLFVLEEGSESFIGASPERLVKKTGRHILSTCLAGSIKRGRNEAEDLELGKALLSDQKNLSEHGFVVSMIRQVLEPFCNGLNVPDAPVLMRMRDIQHLYTPVTGTVKDKDTTLFQLVKALHPTPALGGIPRQPAMEAIRLLEKMDRGLYGAPIGWVDYRGSGEFCVGIRSGLLKEDHASLYAGCGVVKESEPEEEYKETSVKFTPMLRALGGK